MLVWATKIAFLLLVPLALIAAWNFWRRNLRKPTLQFSATGFKKEVRANLRTRLRALPLLLYLAAVVLAIFALARPQKADVKVKKNVEGIDIMLVLDISDSMLIEDMNPNRLEACKEVMKQFVKGRVSDRIGFVVFSGEAYTRVPLTLDYKLLTESISAVKITRNIKMGTAIGVALATASARLRESTAKSRVVVFLTDGENNSGTIDPETALAIAKGYGLKIYSIGAGKDGDAQLPIETTDAFGRKQKTYQPIHSTVNDELLGKFASETGGKYYRATNGAALEKVFKDIDRLEKTKIDVNQYTKYAELFPPWLMAAVGCLLAGQVLGWTIFRRVP